MATKHVMFGAYLCLNIIDTYQHMVFRCWLSLLSLKSGEVLNKHGL